MTDILSIWEGSIMSPHYHLWLRGCKMQLRYEKRINLHLDGPKNSLLTQVLLIRRAIDESFVSGFRQVMLIGTALAAASAVVAVFWIGAIPRVRPSGKG